MKRIYQHDPVRFHCGGLFISVGIYETISRNNPDSDIKKKYIWSVNMKWVGAF
jgi:hypothetical protein